MNGFWKRVIVVAASIITLAGAWAVVETWAPWAPRVTLVMAAENSLERLTVRLLTLKSLVKQTENPTEQSRLLALIAETERKIDRIIVLRKKY